MTISLTGRRARRATPALGLVLGMFLATPLWAAPVAFPTNTTAVTLDGTALGDASPGTSLRTSVARASDGTYHLWMLPAGTSSLLSEMVHATSADGIHFTSQGKLTPPANYWQLMACGPSTSPEPISSFVRVSQSGGEWLMTVWHPNAAGQNTFYSYSSSIWRLGTDPANLTPTLAGPLPSTSCGTANAPGRHHLGTFGIADGRLWLRQSAAAGALPGARGGNVGGYTFDLGTSPPTTSPRPSADPGTPKQTREADLFAGTGYYETGSPPPATRAYVYNAGRTLAQGGALGTYYSFADYNSAAALEQDMWYVESTDRGSTWTAPARIYPGQGATVLVDGLPNRGNFSGPEVTSDGRTYFATRDACNNNVLVTAAGAAADPRLAIRKQFSPSNVPVGGTSQLSITVQAPAGCAPAPAGPVVTNLALTDPLPAGVTLTGAITSNTCGGTLSAPAGGSTLNLTGVALSMGQSCSAVVEVRADSAGTHNNVIAASAVTNDQLLAPASDASAPLVAAAVQAVPVAPPAGLALLATLVGAVAVWRRPRRQRRA